MEQGLTEVEVAVAADHASGGAGIRALTQALTDLLTPRPDRLERLDVVGEVEEDPLDLLVDRRGEQAERLGTRFLGGENRILRGGRERGMHRSGDRAQSTQPTEEAVRRDHDLVQRELPPVDPPGHELLEHAKRRLRRPSDVRVPAEKRGDVRELLPAEEPQHLQPIDPGFETAVTLRISSSSKTTALFDCLPSIRREDSSAPSSANLPSPGT